MRSKYYYISVCCLVILLCGTMLAGMQLSAVRDKKGFKAVVGSLYEKNPEIAAQVLQSALNSDRAHSQEMAEMGEKAAEQLGYTDKVYDFYFFRLGKREEQVFWGIFCAGIGTLLIVICSKGYTSFLKQLDDLRRRIRKTTEQEEEFMMEVDGEKEWIRLEYEIRDIIKGRQKQERYLRRRQKQMELFIGNVDDTESGTARQPSERETVGTAGFERTVDTTSFGRTVGTTSFERTVGTTSFERAVGTEKFGNAACTYSSGKAEERWHSTGSGQHQKRRENQGIYYAVVKSGKDGGRKDPFPKGICGIDRAF